MRSPASTRRASTSASRSQSPRSARSFAIPTRPRSSATTRSSRLPLPREAPTRLGIGRSFFPWCALPRRWIAETGSGDTGSSPSFGTAQADGRCPWVGEAAGEGIVLRRLFCVKLAQKISRSILQKIYLLLDMTNEKRILERHSHVHPKIHASLWRRLGHVRPVEMMAAGTVAGMAAAARSAGIAADRSAGADRACSTPARCGWSCSA